MPLHELALPLRHDRRAGLVNRSQPGWISSLMLAVAGKSSGPGSTAIELEKFTRETRRLLPLLPLREERVGERRPQCASAGPGR